MAYLNKNCANYYMPTATETTHPPQKTATNSTSSELCPTGGVEGSRPARRSRRSVKKKKNE
jgi:hypothetical protein